MQTLDNAGFDLLKIGPLCSVLLWRGLPPTLQSLVVALLRFPNR
jgi:hypothetical protein